MKALLLRVGIDKGTGGALGPIFEDDTFEYIPIPEKSSNTKENRTYNDLFDRYGNSLSTYLPKGIGNKIIHFDPEFETFTYGDPTSKRNALLQLKRKEHIKQFQRRWKLCLEFKADSRSIQKSDPPRFIREGKNRANLKDKIGV